LYVVNNPLRYNDPYGWWTFSIGIFGQGGCGAGATGAVAIAIDGHGNIGLVSSTGVMGVGGASVATGFQLQFTTADTVSDLEGKSSQSGGSTNFPNAALASAGASLGPRTSHRFQ